VSIGLIVAELVANAFKHAFVGDAAAGLVVVAYEAAEASWRLVVSDNGVGTSEGQLDSDKPRPGRTGYDHRRGTCHATRRSRGSYEEPTRHDGVDCPWNTRSRVASARGRRDTLAAKIKRQFRLTITKTQFGWKVPP
jgi:hypothetical protein